MHEDGGEEGEALARARLQARLLPHLTSDTRPSLCLSRCRIKEETPARRSGSGTGCKSKFCKRKRRVKAELSR